MQLSLAWERCGFLNLLDDSELGKFKDELRGDVIEDSLFLGIKQYGFTYNKNGVIVENLYLQELREMVSHLIKLKN